MRYSLTLVYGCFKLMPEGMQKADGMPEGMPEGRRDAQARRDARRDARTMIYMLFTALLFTPADKSNRHCVGHQAADVRGTLGKPALELLGGQGCPFRALRSTVSVWPFPCATMMPYGHVSTAKYFPRTNRYARTYRNRHGHVLSTNACAPQQIHRQRNKWRDH